MGSVIAHRGPDDEGFLDTSTRHGEYDIGLVHRRLSIIDLDSGHQPIGNEDGSVQVVFNGEIYNYQGLRDELIARGHQFRTASDTETIVHAYEEYGDDCVEHFRGMFAFVIWDARCERLFMARDRFGKKPLYLCEHDGSMLFASEIKSLLQYPRLGVQADMAAIRNYLMYRYVPGPSTLFSNIVKLQPGCCAVWENSSIRKWRYYNPPDCEVRDELPLQLDPVGIFLEKLEEAVSIRMVSDVPFGAFLSGGIDSSAIVGLMSRHSDYPVRTFSVGFTESSYSELGYAKTIAEHFGTEHHELTVSQEHLMDELPGLVRFRDAPVAEPSDIPIYLLSKEARKTVKMVLTGEGSDEFLGGYPKHVFERYAASYQMIPASIRNGLLEPLVQLLPYRFRRAKTAISTLGLEDWQERMARWFGALSVKQCDALIAFQTVQMKDRGKSVLCAPDGNSALRKILCFDQTSWLPDNLLERGDRMTMAASLEARMPFMDHELADFVSTLPDKLRVRGHTTKWILREAMRRLLPREHVDGRHNHEKLLWCLLNLEIWHREYHISA
jgi:asparagine synthase (glutamine-hydrolysing)